MLRVQQNRYLWVHFVGLAAVPLLLDICLAGLASAGPAFDYPTAGSLQFWAIALLGIIPTLWMQLAKPFYIFSLPPLALKPTELSEDQRRCLQLLKTLQMKVLAVLTAGFAGWLLWWLYGRSPQITPVMTPTAGLVSAAITFFLVCAFLQIAVSAGRSILVGPDTLKRVVPVEESAIASNFLILGLRVKKILPTEIFDASDNLAEDSEPSSFDSAALDELVSEDMDEEIDTESPDFDGAEIEEFTEAKGEESALESNNQAEAKPEDADPEAADNE